MSVAVTMKGLLEAIELEGSYLEAVNALNMAAGSGKKFVLMEGTDGLNKAVAIDNILVIAEQDIDARFP